MICEKCNKNKATMHVQHFINGIKKEMNICHECSLKLENIPISIENIFQGFLEQMKNFGQPGQMGQLGKASNPFEPQKIVCPRCQMAYDQFKADGKLGCEACYQAFQKPVEALIKNVQGSIRHTGKFPQRSGTELLQQRQVKELRVSLKSAIEEENFEEAARLRDEIRELEGANK